MRDFDVVLLEDETGGYVAIVPALPGVIRKVIRWLKLWQTPKKP